MTCPRCAGLLVVEEMVDVVESSDCLAVRCVNCGLLDDPVAAAQRVSPPAAIDGRRLPRPVLTGVYTYKR